MFVIPAMGSIVGSYDGTAVGSLLGSNVGCLVGSEVGLSVALDVGSMVGSEMLEAYKYEIKFYVHNLYIIQLQNMFIWCT